MKKIFVILVLFLFSLVNNSVLADIGDAYICETSQYVEVNAERKSVVDNETFAFRWHEDTIEFIKMGMGNFSTQIILPKLGSVEMFYSVFYMDYMRICIFRVFIFILNIFTLLYMFLHNFNVCS